MLRHDGGWMFISHSNKDIDLVREIRNTLEKDGFNPITFFLKCVTDSDELDELIKREIRARKWFILIDSVHSRNSKWVQAEISYVKTLPRKKIFVVDTSRNYLPQLRTIMYNTRIYMSFCPANTELASQIRDKLLENDYEVVNDSYHSSEDIIDNFAHSELLDLKYHDRVFLALVTQEYFSDPHCLLELMYMAEHCHRSAAVVIGTLSLSSIEYFHLHNIKHHFVTETLTETELTELIYFLDTQIN